MHSIFRTLAASVVSVITIAASSDVLAQAGASPFGRAGPNEQAQQQQRSNAAAAAARLWEQLPQHHRDRIVQSFNGLNDTQRLALIDTVPALHGLPVIQKSALLEMIKTLVPLAATPKVTLAVYDPAYIPVFGVDETTFVTLRAELPDGLGSSLHRVTFVNAAGEELKGDGGECDIEKPAAKKAITGKADAGALVVFERCYNVRITLPNPTISAVLTFDTRGGKVTLRAPAITIPTTNPPKT